eukprot:2323466-Rhodomonas_salina.1
MGSTLKPSHVLSGPLSPLPPPFTSGGAPRSATPLRLSHVPRHLTGTPTPEVKLAAEVKSAGAERQLP